MKRRAILILFLVLIGSLICLATTACTETVEPTVVTYSDTWNSAVWEKAYSNLVSDYGYQSDYNMFRSACKSLTGDNVTLNGTAREGVRLSEVEKETTDILDVYTLSLTSGESYSFAVLGYLPEDETMSFYEIYKLYHEGITMSESTFISRFAVGDIYATLTIDAVGGVYGESEVIVYTDLCGFVLELDDPVKGDEIFYGWFTDDEYTEKVSDSVIKVDTDTTVYASWQPYDYASVDYTIWDNLKGSVSSSITSFYTDDMVTALSEIETAMSSKRGELTQSEVNSYVNEYYRLLRYAEFVDADTVRIYISTSATISKDDYISAQIAIADESGGEYGGLYDASGQIKIRGNSTSTVAKVGYNIKFSSKVSVLGMAKAKKWCLLANAFDKTMARNALAFELAERLGLAYVSDYKVAELYLNGKNIGCYMIVESIDVGEEKVDIDTENGDALLELEADTTRWDDDTFYFYTPQYGLSFGVAEPNPITAKEATHIISVISDAELAIKEKNFTKISQYIDVESFVNVYIINEYLKNVDVWMSSLRFYIKDGVLYAGPIWDYDLTAGNISSSYYPSYCNYSSSDQSYRGTWATTLTWFNDLMECEEFVAAVASKYQEMQSQIISLYAGADNFLDTFYADNEGVITRNYTSVASGGAGWEVYTAMSIYEMSPKSTYSANLQYLKEWLNNRNGWMLSYLGLV